MPEGHTIHRLARALDRRFARTDVDASSPQGRFEAGAAVIDGTRFAGARAHGKHLLVSFAHLDAGPGVPLTAGRPPRGGARHVLHVHLGLYGRFATGVGTPPAVRGALRLRLVGVPAVDVDTAPPWAELRGPTACELLEPDEVAALTARLGPDPLQSDPRGEGRALFAAGVGASRSAVGALLMRQDLVAGIGNIYRAEALFRAGVHPLVPGREVPTASLLAMWDDLVVLMRAGVRSGRIVTTEPEHRSRSGRARREDAHYVYRRTGQPCRVCGAAVEGGTMVARTVFWCPACQAG